MQFSTAFSVSPSPNHSPLLWLIHITLPSSSSPPPPHRYLLLAVYTSEVILRVYAAGWAWFWWQPNSFFEEMKARYDTTLTLSVLVLVIIERSANGSGSAHFELWPAPLPAGGEATGKDLTDAARVILSINSLRIFSDLKRLKTIFFGLLYSMPTFASVAGVCIGVIHAYAISGCLLMGGKFMYVRRARGGGRYV